MSRIRIVYNIAWMEVGGSQTHLLQVLERIDRTQFEPVLYCLTGHGALLDAVRRLDVPVLDGGMARGFWPPQMLAGIGRMTRALRARKADIVHNYLLRANIVGSVAARLAGVPVMLCSKRGCHWRSGGELVGARLSNMLADCVMTNAEAVREFVHENERCPREKMVVIPSGIDTRRFQPLPAADFKSRLGLDPHRPVVGTVTRGRVRKGVLEFIEAVISLREEFPGLQVLIVGEVELDESLRRRAEESGLVPDLHLPGRRSDMPEVLSAFDIFVLPSHDEGMSNAILEAMAMQIPVVATDVGGTGEVVREGETGLLVPPREPQPLAEAIAALLRAPERAAAMGQAGRPVVEESFSAASMVRDMERMYRDLLHSRRPVRASPIPVADASREQNGSSRIT